MEIKFKKLFKTTLLFFVVFVMIFNSFAAISVSDGSAFVTKAEFSADLNNLSNRMSALENSIDAKIDSLVSSYLSRNGIWNGELQSKTVNYLDFPAPNNFGSYNGGGYVVNSQTNTDNIDIFTSTKSGMIVFNFSYKARHSDPTKWFWGYAGLYSTLVYKNLSDDNISLYMNIYEKSTNTLMASYLFGSASAVLQTPYIPNQSTWEFGKIMLLIPMPGSDIYNTLIFFVEKGKTYYAKISARANIGYMTTMEQMAAFSGNARVTFRNLYVY